MAPPPPLSAPLKCKVTFKCKVFNSLVQTAIFSGDEILKVFHLLLKNRRVVKIMVLASQALPPYAYAKEADLSQIRGLING
jgi:hypothetical protein